MEETLRQGYPYHWILLWLSKLPNEDQLGSLLKQYQKNLELEGLQDFAPPLVWLLHIEQCLNYFDAENKQGKGTVIKNMKERGTFFQLLSHLEIAWKFKHQGYVVDLEVPTNTKKRIDIVASKDGLTVDLELATLDMYADLKHMGFAAEVPDKAKTTMLDKLSEQISDYARGRSNPIILILNRSHAPDVDLHGIVYALHGSGVDHIITDQDSRIVNRYTTFERDPDFLDSEEGNKLSAVIYYKNENDGKRMKLVGDIIPNDSAEVKLEEKTIAKIKEALFE